MAEVTPGDGTKATTVETVPGLQEVLGNLTAAVQKATAAAEAGTKAAETCTAAAGRVEKAVDDLRTDVDQLRGDVERIKSHVFGSDPPTTTAPPPGTFPLDEVATGAHRLAEEADDKADKVSARLDAIQAELRQQSTAMGIGRKWFEFLATPAGRQKALAVLATFGALYASARLYLHVPPSPAPAAAPAPIVVVVPASSTTAPTAAASSSVLPPEAVSR